MKRLKVICAALIAMSMMVSCLFVFSFMAHSRARRELPWFATYIREHYNSAGFRDDHSIELRARINAADFDAYADRLGLNKTCSSHFGPVDMDWHSCSEAWWTPPDSLKGARYERGDDWAAMAKYDAGYVYVQYSKW